jgi:uncharacterized membrane protein YsdA (DUF1294 family)
MLRRVYRRRPSNPTYVHAILAALISVTCTIGLWAMFSQQWSWQAWLLAWLVSINGTTLVYFGYDKARARGEGSRVPEMVLHVLSLIGGSVGAFLGMMIFRHKTIKGRFWFVYGLIVVLQAGLVAFILYEWFA